MCGFTGYWSLTSPADPELAKVMGDAIRHRGPDAGHVWLDERREIAFAHRRLAIIDLSESGHQPMVSACGRYTIIYNGEIYNHLDLRQELASAGASPSWRGHSDTETLLAALANWGVEKCLAKLNGMFAFALWDAQDRALYLARDRMGEKPLYYGVIGGTLFFGSELKSFKFHPAWAGEIDRSALASFLRFNYVPGDRSIYCNIGKLQPAHFIRITGPQLPLARPICYWDINQAARNGMVAKRRHESDLTDELEALLRDSVERRMMSDVSLGAFLSGGIDSSAVVAMMQSLSSKPVRTFTIGFHERDYDEASHAKAVAAHLGTDHTELYVEPRDALDTIPQLPHIWDEPFADSSQIPTLLLSRLTREHVTVSLSGDGGDELFCGYNRYALGHSVWSKLGILPYPARKMLAAAMTRAPNAIAAMAGLFLPAQNLADRLPKLAQVLNERSEEDYYRNLTSHWQDPDALVLGGQEFTPTASTESEWAQLPTFHDRMMLADMKAYLPDDILVKLDRASMAVSLESRVPLLDHRLVEFAWQVPLDLKYRKGVGKYLLRQVLYRHVPQALIDRPKMGFGIPIDQWLRGPLREWSEDLLDEKRMREEGYLDPAPIRQKWQEHLSGKRRWHYLLWDVLMFQAWLRAQ